MKIGVYGGNVRRGATLNSLVDEVAQMEKRGFASYWFSQVDSYDALTVIALAGQQTSTIELGVGVVPTYPGTHTPWHSRRLQPTCWPAGD